MSNLKTNNMELFDVKIISEISTIINQVVDTIDDTFAVWSDLEDCIIYDYEDNVIILDDDYLLTASQFRRLYELADMLDFCIVLRSDLNDQTMDQATDNYNSEQSFDC